MDLATAENHKSKLQKELDALIDSPSPLSIARKFLAIEVDRLNQQITSASSALRSLVEGSVSEIKFAIENDTMLIQICREFGFSLKDLLELEVFQSHLFFEVAPMIKSFRQPLPLAYQLTKRVIELLEDEIQEQEKKIPIESPTLSGIRPPSPRSGSSTPRSRFYYEELNKSIDDAIKEVLERSREDAESYRVLDILKENGNVVIDEYVKRTVCKKFFETTFALNSKPPPEE